jgi:7-keto-8-aminopelargonate synthetase-like enzyme
MSDKAYQATTAATLEQHITDVNIPKNEAEWWAQKEIERLRKYEKLVHFIANDYHELSHDKAQWQRDEWKKRCKKLIEEDNK